MVRDLKHITGAVSSFVYTAVSSRIFFLSALVSLPAFLLLDSVIIKTILTLFYICFMLLLGKGFRLMPNVMVFLSITLLNLFSPIGKVLLSLGPFVITRGALDNGILKSVTFIGLIYLSRISVRRDLEFPGKLGALLSRTFFYFDMMASAWKKSGRDRNGGDATSKGAGAAAKNDRKREGLIERLDNLFYTVSARLDEKEGDAAAPVLTSWKGWVCVMLFIACHWGLFLYSVLRLRV